MRCCRTARRQTGRHWSFLGCRRLVRALAAVVAVGERAQVAGKLDAATDKTLGAHVEVNAVVGLLVGQVVIVPKSLLDRDVLPVNAGLLRMRRRS